MEQLIVSDKTGCSTLLLIDYFVQDNSLLIDSTNANTLPILYSYQSSKIELLDVIRSKFTTIDRMGILFTQGNANLFLDKNHFFVQENIDFIVGLIRDFGIKHLDFLACETLLYPAWIRYYENLRTTGVTLGASSNKTGSRMFVSDWTMESTGENIELVYFTKQVELYKYLLDVPNRDECKMDECKIDENVNE